MNPLSSLNRQSIRQKLGSETYDLLVIGGGITGAGIALDAALRGMKVALVEKGDFASGTSSRSTKLIHGGLRYLKQLDIGLVREVGSERAIVHKLAPHLVIPEKMLLPLIENGTYGYLATSFGLKVYDVLAGVQGDDRRRMLSRDETIEKEPLLRKDFLKAGGYYAEYRTDDARLTIEVIKTAVRKGALCLNYIKAEDFNYENNQLTGVQCKDMDSGDKFNIRAHFVVSAAGPWVDQLRAVNKSLNGKHLFHSKGVHLVVAKDRLPIQQAVYFDVPDGRMLFAIPRNKVTYIGTTDTPFKKDIDRIRTNKNDVNYLLDAVNNMFPDAKLTIDDVESSWVGVRPLIHEEGKSASELSRKDEIFESENGLISIAGGKLTGYRKMAERVVDLVVKRFYDRNKQRFKDCSTETQLLLQNAFIDFDEVKIYKEQLQKTVMARGLHIDNVDYLVGTYGKNADMLLSNIDPKNPDKDEALALAELEFGINNELTLHPCDFFIRRTGRLFFDIQSVKQLENSIIEKMQVVFNWDQSKVDQLKNDLECAFQEATEFPEEAV